MHKGSRGFKSPEPPHPFRLGAALAQTGHYLIRESSFVLIHFEYYV